LIIEWLNYLVYSLVEEHYFIWQLPLVISCRFGWIITNSACNVQGVQRVTVQLVVPLWLCSNTGRNKTGSVWWRSTNKWQNWQHTDLQQNATCISCAAVTICVCGNALCGMCLCAQSLSNTL